ncbi:hypothetical protein [Ralstonia insidiosa]|uniref:Uncharacterized protein n=1 Tax=Ralstonia insidiosa TaxID=190721 RepID=A0A848P600_9RALS|nr:hypothetical protein [Ralstonia insidiosa]NMV41120.1 hypothetical protein [Ralstonia insidiosa]
MLNSIPTLTDVRELDGRIFAMLTADELSVLDFYRTQGRKFDVSVAILSEADPTELAAARSPAEAEAIMKRANSRVSVTIGPAAEAAWAARAH